MEGRAETGEMGIYAKDVCAQSCAQEILEMELNPPTHIFNVLSLKIPN